MRIAVVVFTVVVAYLAAAVHAQNDATCQNALDALQYTTKLMLALQNQTFVAAQSAPPDTTPAVTPEALTLFASAIQNVTAVQVGAPADNTANIFPTTTPYWGWGNRLLQNAMGWGLHAPASSLGELAMVANTLTRSTNSSVSVSQGATLFKNAFAMLAENVLEQAQNMTDQLSQRSLLLRYIVYSYVSQFVLPPGPETADIYQQVQEGFSEARGLFAAYEFGDFSYQYSNGTASTTLQGFAAAPSGGGKSPLILFLDSPYVWTELSFMRYGLGALRRGYAMVVMQQPGQVPATTQAPFMGRAADQTPIVKAVLDAIDKDPMLSQLIDTNQVVLYSVVASSIGATAACANLGSRVKACVFSPPVMDYGTVSANALGRILMPAATMMALRNASVLPANLVPLFLDPVNKVVNPLILNCSATSGAPEVLAAALNARIPNYEPELGQAVTATLGTVNPPTVSGVHNAAWLAFRQSMTMERSNPRNITVPVLVLGSNQELSFSGQELAFFQALKPNPLHKLVIFNATTGAAAGVQSGAGIITEQTVYPWLQQVFGTA